MELASGLIIDGWIIDFFRKLGVPTAFIAIIYGSAALLDKMLPEETRATVGGWMLSRQQGAFSVVRVFVSGFDQIFEVKRRGIFYLPSPARSMIISIIVTTVVMCAYLKYLAKGFFLDVRSDSLVNFLEYSFVVIQSKAAPISLNVSVPALILAIIIVNPIVDYILYVKTRFFLQLFSSASSDSRTISSLATMIIFLTIDLVAASVLIFVLFPLFMGWSNSAFRYLSGGLYFSPFPPILIEHLLSLDFFTDFFLGVGKTGLSGTFVYASYATSVWLWGLFLGLAAGRVVLSVLGLLMPATGTLLSRIVLAVPFQVSAVCVLLLVWISTYFITWDANALTDALRSALGGLRNTLLWVKGFLPW